MQCRVLLMLVVLAASACTVRQPVEQTTASQFTDAATTPLRDLNLVRAEIPEVLVAAQRDPYAIPPDRSCAGLAQEIKGIRAALGPDLDSPDSADDPSLIDRGEDLASFYAVDAVHDTATGFVPFRDWIRKLSGAEKYEHKVSAAIAAGGIRRGFLKGLGQAAGCLPPAAPRQP